MTTDDELAALSRAAYSREATPADIDALRAALEARATSAREPEHVPDDSAEPGVRRWLLPTVTALVGLVVGSVIGVSGWLEPMPDPKADLLAQLETLPEADDPHMMGMTPGAQSWLLGTQGDVEYIATVGESDPEFAVAPFDLCFTVIEHDLGMGGSACTTVEEYARTGISITTSFNGEGSIHYWPPFAPPGIPVCEPHLWPTCR